MKPFLRFLFNKNGLGKTPWAWVAFVAVLLFTAELAGIGMGYPFVVLWTAFGVFALLVLGALCNYKGWIR